MRGRRGVRLGIVAAGLVLVCAAAYAQDIFGRRSPAPSVSANVEYDGSLVFVRLRYNSSFGGGYGRRSRDPGWAHDYPTADIHLMRILEELTIVAPRVDGSNILSLDDPELFKFPIAYMSEPGAWYMSDEDVVALRAYLLKGGFIIFDDFRGGDWYNLEEQMRRALPDLRFVQLDATNAIFHSFFEINSLEILTSYGNGVMPTYYGIFEDNDPRKRLLAIANRDGDLGEYWEFSDTGIDPVDLSNEAYKFGVNYFIYGLTH
jgi:hypothetical protein